MKINTGNAFTICFYDFVQGNVILNFSPSCNVSGICLPKVSGNIRANNPLTKAPCHELMRKFFNKDWLILYCVTIQNYGCQL